MFSGGSGTRCLFYESSNNIKTFNGGTDNKVVTGPDGKKKVDVIPKSVLSTTRGGDGTVVIPENTTTPIEITVYYILENGANGGVQHSVEVIDD